MKRKLSYAAAVIVLAVGSIASSGALAQITAPGPYYATPSWDQQLPASTRFIVLANWIDTNFPSGGAAVLDRETGLAWQRTPTGGNNAWSTASRTCMAAKTGGRYGWRLPTVQELGSLLDPTRGRPDDPSTAAPLPAGHPFIGVPNGFASYWTATSDDEDPSRAYRVGWFIPSTTPPNFNVFVGGFPQSKINGASAWCVRGGLQAAGQ